LREIERREGEDENWEKIEEKDKSKDAYKQIEDNMDSVNNSLKAAKPDKKKKRLRLFSPYQQS